MKEIVDINHAHLYLSRERSLYIGRVGEKLSVSKAPSVFVLSLEGEMEVSHDGVHHRATSVVLPADVELELILNNALIAIFFLDFIGQDFTILKHDNARSVALGKSELLLEPSLSESVTQFISQAYITRPSAQQLFQGLESIVASRRTDILVSGRFVADERIVKSIQFIRSAAGLASNIEQIARHVSLSVPRFTQLFRSVTGISVRRFKIWYRMHLASEKLAQGSSFTEAALSAGFSDYAHFSRSFTEMGGVAPSVMLYGSQDLYLDVYYKKPPQISLVEDEVKTTLELV